jgi:hypothetical protein
MPLDLLVPDLLLPADGPAAMRAVRLPHLERWLARGDLERGKATSAIEGLASAFGVALPAPVAAVSAAGEGFDSEGAWLRADPVHLRVDRDTVTLHDAAPLELTAGEARELVDTLAAHLAPDVELLYAAPDRWYVRVAAAELPSTTPLDHARGRNVFGLLPKSHGRMGWAGLLTEAQMLLSTHPVNAERERRGLPPVNSIWFWGEGSVPDHVTAAYADVHSGDAFARGLARLSGARVHPLPERLDALDVPARDAHALVVLDTLAAPLHRVDIAAWQDAALALDEQWFGGLADAIERFDRVRLVMPTDNGTRIAVLTPRARRRWFRRARPLAHHA